jgi:urea carboxylase
VFKQTQSAAFRAERERWAAAGQDLVTPTSVEPERRDSVASLPPGTTAVTSPVAGGLWKVLVEPGQQVEVGMAVAIVEAMKTEITIVAHAEGRVQSICAAPGSQVVPGSPLVVLE